MNRIVTTIPTQRSFGSDRTEKHITKDDTPKDEKAHHEQRKGQRAKKEKRKKRKKKEKKEETETSKYSVQQQ